MKTLTYLALPLLPPYADEVPDLAPEVAKILDGPLMQVLVVMELQAVLSVDELLEAVHLCGLGIGVPPQLNRIGGVGFGPGLGDDTCAIGAIGAIEGHRCRFDRAMMIGR